MAFPPFDPYSLGIAYASKILQTVSLFGIQHCATSPSGRSVMLATCVDPDISVYGMDICIYDVWSPTMYYIAISECKQ